MGSLIELYEEYLNAVMPSVSDMFSNIFGESIDYLVEKLGDFIGKLLYYFVAAICYILKLVYEFFSVFSGIKTVEYDGKEDFLINIFFGNKYINNIYWGMAMIGFVFIFALTIIAVVRKIFDMAGKDQRSLGAIIMSAFKSMLTILLLTAVLSAVLNITNTLVASVSSLFDNADAIGEKNEMYFTNEQYATMARIYNTIGNYSINPSYKSRYNLNSCYNAIRQDLYLLQEQGVFTFYYGDEVTWQSVLTVLAKCHDPSKDIMIDAYDETTQTVLYVMEILKTNNSFYPLSYIKRITPASTAQSVSLDRVIFIMGTFDAARNEYFNKEPACNDAVRGPFYYGEKDIYDFDQVTESFDTGITGISYVIITLLVWFTLMNLCVCIFNCIARIFNIIGLYIIAPPMIATSPLDNGEKFKQWITAMTVQMFGIFGSIIPMRLIILFIPIILDNKLVLFPDNVVFDLLAKGLLIAGSVEAANKFGQIITGILANNAGFAAITAGDMSQFAKKGFSATFGNAAAFVGKTAASSVGLTQAAGFLGKGASALMDHGVFGAGSALSMERRKKDVEMKQLEESEKRYGLNGNKKPDDSKSSGSNGAPPGSLEGLKGVGGQGAMQPAMMQPGTPATPGTLKGQNKELPPNVTRKKSDSV